ncbi:DUF397 domain-containing protein [Streptomyces katsurahamanus]|uniref:DUF397 domain-containing protein n=1 Tax=Streptomyces katsurahamanus TaxID=2577098 RepID=A0ABW9NTS8_9ACTN|nr:DUF397 domain-containing protein [Streptomyces katsurahamanus]MQS36691.1 DUF397 domain-containing protein [Streptomyces katsurahamanus]
MVTIPDSTAVTSWRKSSYSNGAGAACVEVATSLWRKSSYSNGEGAVCVEVLDGIPGVLPVRDSKNPHGPALTFTPGPWTAFIRDLKAHPAL